MKELHSLSETAVANVQRQELPPSLSSCCNPHLEWLVHHDSLFRIRAQELKKTLVAPISVSSVHAEGGIACAAWKSSHGYEESLLSEVSTQFYDLNSLFSNVMSLVKYSNCQLLSRVVQDAKVTILM
jgi:hypothetical protein